MSKSTGRLLGRLVAYFGLVGAAFAFLAFHDPVGAKMADDGDPFGDPGTRIDHLKLIAIYVLVAVAGFWWVARHKDRSP